MRRNGSKVSVDHDAHRAILTLNTLDNALLASSRPRPLGQLARCQHNFRGASQDHTRCDCVEQLLLALRQLSESGLNPFRVELYRSLRLHT